MTAFKKTLSTILILLGLFIWVPSAHADNDTLDACNNKNKTFTITPSQGATEVQWYIDGVLIPTAHSSSYTHRFTTEGIHSVMALLHGGCYPEWCDTLRRTVMVHPSYRDTSYVSICANEEYFFDATHSYNTSRTISAMYKTIHQCDSVRTVVLSVRDTTSGDTIAIACDSLVWHDSVYRTSTEEPTFHSLNSVMCDSVTTLRLTVRNSTTGAFHEEVVQNQLPYNFHGHSYSSDTSDIVVISNMAGCDSVISYSLIVHPNVSTSVDSAICDDLIPFTWNGVTFSNHVTQSTTFSRSATLHNQFGADSTVLMNLTVHPVFNESFPVSICDNGSTSFEGTTYSVAGSYPWAATTVHGCDSVRTLVLDVRGTSAGDTIANVCDSLMWHDSVYRVSTESPTFHSLNSVMCDSVTTLHLTVRYSSASSIHEEKLENDLPYSFNGLVFNDDTAGAVIVIPNTEGCDSTITYSLTVFWNDRTYVDSTVCDDMLPLTWNGVIFAAGGISTATLTNVLGADSLVSMTLHVNPTYSITIPASICDNETYPFEGTIYDGSDAGQHPYMQQTNVGCDSLRTLDLEVRFTTASETLADVCDSLVWHDSVYRTSTEEPTFHSLNSVMCDSVTTLRLTVRNSTTGAFHEEVVQNQLPYNFHGHSYSSDTSDIVVISNMAGCDSVISYSLIVHPNVSTSVDSAICDDLIPFTWNGVTFSNHVTQSTTFSRSATLHNQFGADSTVLMNLTVHPVYNDTLQLSLCDNQSIVFGGITYTSTIVHTDSLASVAGCDSISTLNLTVWPTYDHHTFDTICSNQNYPFCDTAYNITGIFPHQLSSEQLCDSTSTLHLQVWPAYDNTTYDTICDDATRFFIDTYYNGTGIYPYPLHTREHGCDSIETLNLKVFATYNIEFHDTIYEGDIILFDDFEYEETGIYTHLMFTEEGCDSSRTLYLQCNRRSYVDTSLCQNMMPLTWNGIIFSNGDGERIGNDQVIKDSTHLTGRLGIDSLVVMTVTIHDTSASILPLHACDSLQWQDGNTYTHSTESPSVRLSNAANCDSVVHLNLTVDYTARVPDIIEICDSLRWIDHRLYTSDTIGALDTLVTTAECDSIVTLNLTVHHSTTTTAVDTMCYNDTYIWYNHSVHGNDDYQKEHFTLSHTLQTDKECDSVVTLTVTKMAKPSIGIRTTENCMYWEYILDADADNTYYIRWESAPYDLALVGHENDRTIRVSPQETTEYHLYADYRPEPLCPIRESVAISPYIPPAAELKVNPESLNSNLLQFTAYDTERNPAAIRTWFINGEQQAETGPTLEAHAQPDADSVVITLDIIDTLCHRTSSITLPIYRVSVLVPNIFTPSEGTNNRFKIVSTDVTEGELFIYNRDGMQVYRSTNLEEGWDGSHNGTQCSQGSYVWKFTYRGIDGLNHTDVGSLLLLR